jgi:O-antigen biosynthesis protein
MSDHNKKTPIFLNKNQVIILNPPPDQGLDLVDLTNCKIVTTMEPSVQENALNLPFNPLEKVNLIANSDFVEKTSYWQSEPQQQVDFSCDFPNWTLEGGHTAYIYQNGMEPTIDSKIVYFPEENNDLIPILPQKNYQLSGYFGLHRCHGILQVELLDQEQNLIEIVKVNLPVESNKLGGKNLEGYYLAKEQFVTSEKMVFARIIIIKKSTIPNEKRPHSFLFFTRLFFGCVPNGENLTWKKAEFTSDIFKDLYTYCLGKSANFLTCKLPLTLADGKEHKLQVLNAQTGEILTPEPLIYQEQIAWEGAIENIDHATVSGWARYSFKNESLQLKLIIDGVTVAQSIANIPHDKGNCGFRFSLPKTYLDGRVHYFTLVEESTNLIVTEIVEITTFILTPWEVLQKYSNPPFRSYLAPMAGDRYQNLQLCLQAIAQENLPAEYLQNLSFFHDKLVAGFERKQQEFSPLSFPIYEKPKVSIIIPVHNKFAVTYNCLVAVLFAYNEASYEVIVVDDGSEDKTLDLPELVTGITYLRHETAQGFILTCNLGAKSAKGDYLVFLNNDTEPTAKWLDEMLFIFENFKEVGLVGSKLVYPNGQLQEAGGIVWGTGDPWNYGRGGNANDPKFNYTRQVDYVSGASLMIPHDLWLEVKGFSEELCPAYFEDTDLSFKVQAANKKVIYTPFSKVYHYEGISSGTSVASGMKRFQEINRPKFKRKWSSLYHNNGEVGKDVDLNKDRGIRYRALFIDLETPRPDQDAGSYAALQEIRLFQSLGFKVTFIPENLAYLGNYTDNLQRLGIEMIYAPFYLSVQDLLEARGKEFDVVYITRYQAVNKHLANVRQYAPQAKVMFCNADLHFLRMIREAIQNQDQSKLQEATKVRDMELDLMRKVDVTLSYNHVEHSVVLSHNLGTGKVVTCPWVVDVKKKITPFEERQDIAFIGGFRHPPNVQSVKFFIQSVMPLLRQQLPGVKFLVYGSNVTPELEKMETEDIMIKGYVESVEEVYDHCRIAVSPLLFGAGIKGKVLDALSYGVPQVLSPVAAESTGVRDGLEVYIAQKPEDWAEKIVKLYNNQEIWENMSKAARIYAQANFSFAKGRELMGHALEAVEIYPNYDKSFFVYGQAR